VDVIGHDHGGQQIDSLAAFSQTIVPGQGRGLPRAGREDRLYKKSRREVRQISESAEGVGDIGI